MDEATNAELHYLIGRLIGLRVRVGQDIDTAIYYEQYRIRIDVVERKEVVRSTKKE